MNNLKTDQIRFSKMGVQITIRMVGVFTTLFLLLSAMISVHAAPKNKNSDGVQVAYSISETKSSSSSSSSTPHKRPTARNILPVAESTLPHVPVLRETNESDQQDMSTSTPSSESLESQLQSPHVIRKKALVDFDTSSDDLLQTLEAI